MWLLPLALLPLAASSQRVTPLSSIAASPVDGLSRLIGWSLRAAGILAIGGLVVALAGPYRQGETITRTGIGAQVSILVDRSGSMNETFAGLQPSGAEESKAAASRRLLGEFVGSRAHDQFAVSAFSTAPMLVVPMTDRHEAVRAAIAAIDRPGLDYTNVARGLGMALSQFGASTANVSRALLIVSDGAAVIDPRVQGTLRAEFARTSAEPLLACSCGRRARPPSPTGRRARTPLRPRPNDISISSSRASASPYRAFEAEGAEAVADAIGQIERLERDPIPYIEQRPRRDLAGWAYGISLLGLILLVAAKLAETDLGRNKGRSQTSQTGVPTTPQRRLAA